MSPLAGQTSPAGTQKEGEARPDPPPVGSRLRAIRRQMGMSLQDVEALSGHEFRASVLGAYERDERVISVPRLQRLARLYNVPVEQLLPRPPDEPSSAGGGGGGSRPGERSPAGADKVTFDLARFEQVTDPEAGMVRRYLNSIAVRRQDFNGRVLTVRGDDIRAIAGLFGVEPAQLVARLDDLQLRVSRPAGTPAPATGPAAPRTTARAGVDGPSPVPTGAPSADS